MAQTFETRPDLARAGADPGVDGRGKHAVSWPAIIAGAFVAAGVSLILLSLGSGLGFASISPWENHGVSATTFAVTTAIWLLVTQWVSASVGGYIAGRLRTRWVGTHGHEVFFRDTAHGLITWAVATVLIAVALAGSASALLGSGVHAAAQAASGGAQGAAMAAFSSNSGYSVDKLFRAPSAGGTGGDQSAGDPRAEAARIVANAVANGGTVSDYDRGYLTQLVAERTGMSQPEAQKRVDDFAADLAAAEQKVKADADAARKAAAEASLYLALSLLTGAFIASVSAALGGRLRDEHP